MIYHTNPGNCHTDKTARAGARQAGALGGCWQPGLGTFLWGSSLELPGYVQVGWVGVWGGCVRLGG